MNSLNNRKIRYITLLCAAALCLSIFLHGNVSAQLLHHNQDMHSTSHSSPGCTVTFCCINAALSNSFALFFVVSFFMISSLFAVEARNRIELPYRPPKL